MSTNINIKTPTPPPVSPPSQEEKGARGTGGPQGAPSTNPGAFQSGNSANTSAILTLIKALMELYEYKNDKFVSVSRAESTTAKCFSESQVSLGNKEMAEMEIQGAFSMFSGLMSGALLGVQIGNEASLGGKQTEINASQDFVNNIGGTDTNQSHDDIDKDIGRESPDDIPLDELETAQSPDHDVDSSADREEEEDAAETELETVQAAKENESEVDGNKEKAKERLEEMITELKAGKYKIIEGSGKSAKAADPSKTRGKDSEGKDNELTDKDVLDTLANEPEMANFKEAANEHIANRKAELKVETDRVAGLLQKRQMGSQAIDGVSKGAGGIGAGIEKQYQGEQNAANTLFSTAQQGFQKLAQETESQADKDLQTAEGLVQLIPDIDKSNNAILTA